MHCRLQAGLFPQPPAKTEGGYSGAVSLRQSLEHRRHFSDESTATPNDALALFVNAELLGQRDRPGNRKADETRDVSSL